MTRRHRWVAAYAPRDVGELALIRSLLDDSEIEYTVSNEGYASLGGGIAFIGDTAVDLLVSPDQVEAVRALLREAGIIRGKD